MGGMGYNPMMGAGGGGMTPAQMAQFQAMMGGPPGQQAPADTRPPREKYAE